MYTPYEEDKELGTKYKCSYPLQHIRKLDYPPYDGSVVVETNVILP
jgi:hypothetical protein